jgi:hypothetical protein
MTITDGEDEPNNKNAVQSSRALTRLPDGASSGLPGRDRFSTSAKRDSEHRHGSVTHSGSTGSSGASSGAVVRRRKKLFTLRRQQPLRRQSSRRRRKSSSPSGGASLSELPRQAASFWRQSPNDDKKSLHLPAAAASAELLRQLVVVLVPAVKTMTKARKKLVTFGASSASGGRFGTSQS